MTRRLSSEALALARSVSVTVELSALEAAVLAAAGRQMHEVSRLSEELGGESVMCEGDLLVAAAKLQEAVDGVAES